MPVAKFVRGLGWSCVPMHKTLYKGNTYRSKAMLFSRVVNKQQEGDSGS